MRVTVLGTIGVENDGEVALGGPTQRRTLALLVLRANQVVSLDQLVGAVWPDGDAPDRAEHNVRTYVHRLRSALQPEGDRIETVAGGYRLRLDRDELDATRFEDLVASARAAAHEGDLTRSRELLDEALALWQGRPYDEFADAAWWQPEVVRLAELRASAVEHRFAVLLDAGCHTEVVGPLHEAIVDEPWREARRAQYALALYRAGRQAEALRAVQDYRSALADELGLDPSPDLRELEHRILDHDPTLLPPSHAQHLLRGYELDEVVGEGAFSLVWRGEQPALGRKVAVKQIRADLANQPEFVRRFETEAQTVAALEHPYIVPLYDYWREPDNAYLVMRYVPGGSLESLVLDGGLDEARLRRFVEQVGTALHVAHRMNVIHRDVKSANVLVDGDGNFFLTDFGIAFIGSAADDELANSLSTGSPAYASPEQLRRQELDTRTDIYGFGITLFEAATGRLPFADAPTQAALVQRQLDDPVPVPSSIDPTVPRWVDEIVARATAKNPADRFSSMADLVSAVPADTAPIAEAGRRPGSATVIGDLVNPFKALRAFREADAADFHGRERLVARLVEVLSLPGSAGRLLAVVGPSGSGKSSVVRSGLVPQLREGTVAGSGDWFITTMLPGAHPFDELESALSRVAVRQPGPLVEMMRSDDRGIARAVNQILPDEESELVLVIDQFEELFTHASDVDCTKFLDGLLGAVREPRARMRVVLTIRADLWDRPLRHPALAARLETAAVTVSPLAADELEAAIVEPVRRQGAMYEPGLVARIIADVGDEPGALPLLQYALTELFDTQVSGLILAESYDAIGGLAGALAKRAEQTLASLTVPQQLAAQRAFGRLVTLGEGTEDTRRRVRLGELSGDAETRAVVDTFGDARLLVFDTDPTTREPTVEIAHEALIRAWPRLRGWLDDDRESLRIHRHLTETAGAWVASGRDDGELYRGGRLESAETWAEQNGHAANERELEFLAASVAARDAEVAAERLHLDQQVRSNRRLRVLVGVVAVAAMLAGAAGLVALQQRSRANDEADEALAQAELAEEALAFAESSQADAESSAATAAARAEEASTERDRADANAEQAEAASIVAEDLRVAAEQQAEIESARAIGLLALSKIDEDVDLAVLLAIESASRAADAGVEVSEARQALFTTTLRHDLRFRIPTWDVPGAGGPLLAWAPSGTRFAVVVAGGDGSDVRRVEVHDLDGDPPVLVDVADPTSVAWNRSDGRLLVGSEGGWIWSVSPATGDATQLLDTSSEWVKVFQVTDRWLIYQTGTGPVSAIADFTVASADDLEPIIEFEDQFTLIVSPSDEALLVVGPNGYPRIHEVPSGELLHQTPEHEIGGWSAEGDAFLMVDDGGTSLIRLEMADLSTTATVLTERRTVPTSFGASPDGRSLAVGATDGAVRTYDAETLAPLAALRAQAGSAGHLAWKPDGSALLSIGGLSIGGGQLGPGVHAWQLEGAPKASAAVWPGSDVFPLGHAVHSESERIVETFDDGSFDIELWSSSMAATPFEGAGGPLVAGADGAFVARVRPPSLGSAGGLVVSDVAARSVVLDYVGAHDVPLAISPDGRTVVATFDPEWDSSTAVEPEIVAIDIATGEVRWTLRGAHAPTAPGGSDAAVFVDDGSVVVVVTGNAYGWPVYDRPSELVAVDVASGGEIASRALGSDQASLAVAPDGSRLATSDGNGRLTVVDVDAWLSGAGDDEIAATTLADESQPFGIAFGEDGRTLYTPAGFYSPNLLALDVHDGLAKLWELDVDVNETGVFAASRPTVHDGHLWVGSVRPVPLGTDPPPEFGIVGIPADLGAHIEWASTVPTRDFTDVECEQLLGVPCADLASRRA